MKLINNRYLILLLILVISIFLGEDLMAQCPMCKMAAESNMKAGGTAGAGLNKGILYMFALPYILVATMAYIWYRQQKRLKSK